MDPVCSYGPAFYIGGNAGRGLERHPRRRLYSNRLLYQSSGCPLRRAAHLTNALRTERGPN